MSKVKLLIADQDEIFTDNISNYILEKSNFFEAICINQPDLLECYLSKNSVDILIGETVFFTDRIKTLSKDALLLSFGDASEDNKSLNKYQKTESLLNDVTFKYAEKIGDKSMIKKSAGAAKIISVYSPAGGTGKTTLAVAVAAILSQRGHRTIYLNLEKINSAGKYFSYNQQMGISKVLLSLKAKSANFSFELMKYLQNDEKSGIFYFAPPESAMEFNEITNEEYARLLEEIGNIKDMDYIIIDHSSEFNDVTVNILKLSYKVICPILETDTCMEKMKLLIQEFNLFPDCKLLLNQFIFILNVSDARDIHSIVRTLGANLEVSAAIADINQIRKQSSPESIRSCLYPYLSNVLQMI